MKSCGQHQEPGTRLASLGLLLFFLAFAMTGAANAQETASGYVGGTFSFLHAVTSATGYASSDLPSWLAIDSSTGLLSGIPPAVATTTVTVTATTTTGTSNFTVAITIIAAPSGVPVFTGLNQVMGSTDGISYQLTATNNPTSFSAPSGLPDGFVLSSSGVLSETSDGPVDNTTYPIEVQATNGAGSTTETLTVNVEDFGSPVLTVLHNFADGSVPHDGNSPNKGLFETTNGSIYGTTANGGNSGSGTVFNLNGTSESVVASLAGTYGTNPVGLVQGSDGNIYGMATNGGSQNLGTIFKITPAGVMTVLHNFGDGTVTNDGTEPAAGLIQGSDGNFYGTTSAGGSANKGTVFLMTPAGQVTILHSFGDGSITSDGSDPTGPLLFVPNGGYYIGANGSYYTDGSYYGTTQKGGSNGDGTVFAITTQRHLTILHNFGAAGDGADPMYGLVSFTDANFPGTINLYGTTYEGGSASGSSGNGTVYYINPAGTSYEVVYTFPASGGATPDGAKPKGNLFVYSTYGLYSQSFLVGTTSSGGASGSAGTIFKLFSNQTQPPSFSESLLYDFSTSGQSHPTSTVVEDINGNLFGMTPSGGTGGGGIAFALQMGQFNLQGVAAPTYVLDPNGSGFTTLPAGMSIEPATGFPLGAPLPSDAKGVYTYNVDNPNSNPPATDTLAFQATLNLGIYSTITTPSLPAALVHSSYSSQLAASNSPSSYTASGLPSTLTCSSSGLIAGTPTTTGTYNVNVSATNSLGQGPPTAFVLTVGQAPAITNGPPPAATLNALYSFTYTTSGYPAPTFSVTAGTLPTGLALSSAGVLSGTPTATGTYTGTVTASNGVGTAATQNFSIVVPQAPSITNGPPPAATLNMPYNFTYTTSGYPVPTFLVTSGALPTGLNLSPAGVLSGTPTATGTYMGTVTASNGVGTAATQNFTISVQQAAGFNQWESSNNFTTANGFTADEIGPADTAFNDGVPNLLKYLCDINPSMPMTTTDRAALPVFGAASNGDLMLTFRYYSLETGITMNVQTSADLQNWTTLSQSQTLSSTTYTIQPVGTPDANGDQNMEVDVQPNGTARQFLRLNVTQP